MTSVPAPNGKINKLTVKLGPSQSAPKDQKAVQEKAARAND
ncbi:hypothetical protein [Anatilimnocola aggregata]|nr:hypothetical protein [Anatilimnocola aggregata]